MSTTKKLLTLICLALIVSLAGCAAKHPVQASLVPTAKQALYCKPLAQMPLELKPMASTEELTILKKRLQIVRQDIEAYRVFAENFSKNGDAKALEQLKKPVDDFLTKHVNRLLATALERKNLDTVQSAAEITFRKARLLQYLGRTDAARMAAGELSETGPYAYYQQMTVVPAGDAGTATTTLGAGYRALDADLQKLEASEKAGKSAQK